VNDDTWSLDERKNTLLARVREYALYIDPLLGRVSELIPRMLGELKPL
jgi:hypothetical protein